MKANKSTRNRHTGRINAYKRRILELGKKFLDSNGKEYRYIESGWNAEFAIRKYSIVRANKLEHAA